MLPRFEVAAFFDELCYFDDTYTSPSHFYIITCVGTWNFMFTVIVKTTKDGDQHKICYTYHTHKV